MLASASVTTFAASDHVGQITFGGLPVPGATVTVTQGHQRVVAVADLQGIYRFSGLADGTWTLSVEMLGFSPLAGEITLPSDTPRVWEIALAPFEQIQRIAPPSPPANAAVPAERAAAAPPGPGFQRAELNAAAAAQAIAVDADPFGDEEQSPSRMGAAEGLLVNGSVNNSAASPFAQARAFGNNRPGQRSQYNGGFGVLLGHSAWDARPFSFTGERAAKPSYTDAQFLGTFGGPLRLLRNGPIVFVGVQRTHDNSASMLSALMPSDLERSGDFSQSRDRFGRPVQLVDPATGLPFPGNVVPRERISPQAASLLGYYPRPTVDGGRFNYQAPVLTALRQTNVQSRFTQALNLRNQIFGTLAYNRGTTDTGSVFGFTDSTRIAGLDGTINWTHRFTQFVALRLRYQFTQLSTDVTPHFAHRTNVSGEAGISGNNQEPANWGPPALLFSSGVAGLSSPQYASNRNRTHVWGAETSWNRGRHNLTFGGAIRRLQFDVNAQQDARGSFSFSGTATGSDLADFLLGIPQSSSIAFGNADKYLRAPAYETFVNDDWRVTPAFTINAGVRWEYEAPLTERQGRLVNLDIASGFTAASSISASNPVGSLTRQQYPESLLRPDWRGIQPRLGFAWRPVPGSSLVVRGGYGLYRSTGVYYPIALLMAQQPPFSRTVSVDNSPANPLTLANGFSTAPNTTLPTFAIDPDFRVGAAQNWQLSVQKDLPASLTVTGAYLGARGSRLMQEVMPNTYPAGAVHQCPTCPVGFAYLTSNG